MLRILDDVIDEDDEADGNDADDVCVLLSIFGGEGGHGEGVPARLYLPPFPINFCHQYSLLPLPSH